MHVVEKCLEFTEREGWRSGGKCASSVPLQFLRRCKRDRESTERHQKSVPVDNRSAVRPPWPPETVPRQSPGVATCATPFLVARYVHSGEPMTPKVQVGTILIEERPLVRQRRCRENNLPSRTLPAMPGEVFTSNSAQVPFA